MRMLRLVVVVVDGGGGGGWGDIFGGGMGERRGGEGRMWCGRGSNYRLTYTRGTKPCPSRQLIPYPSIIHQFYLLCPHPALPKPKRKRKRKKGSHHVPLPREAATSEFQGGKKIFGGERG